ncbi:hypothetical protein HMPREF9431_02452 [Segatella oulorum F0390]|uniref:Fimbrillin family protein n=2 Tax=Segatella oulorum TaxID=28136 RepID=G1WF51_9BACT|nr:hypothetical protein HMPREF9431_02452 [Segatella oulorum F0390]
MKRKNILMMGCLAGLLLLSACSSEENMADTGNKIDVAKGIRFQFTEEAFVPGEVAAAKQGTRALAEPQEIDLGNGIIAEATLEPDTAGCAQTRAGNPVPDGTYKIYAIDAGGTRHDGLTGTMTGGVFTPSGHWELEAGTYTFVCINSAVTDNGNELYMNLNPGQMPLIGVSDPVTVTNPFDVFVSFVMRHPQARIRYQFVSYTEPLVSPILNWLNSDVTYDVGSAYFDLKGNRLRNGGTSAGVGYNGTLHLNQTYQPSSVTKEYTYTTDYILCSPEYNSMTYYAITSNLYGRAIHSNKGVPVGPLQKNHSYIWKLKFKNKEPWYLYNDGTIGSLAKRGSRTPIGIVVKEKTSESDQGTACALDILNYTWKNVDDHIEENISPSPTNMAEAAADMNGENWTYNANLLGTVRSNQATTYPAFYQAAHYTPGVATASSIGRWYLPSYGELIKFVQVFQKGFTPTATEPVGPHYHQMNSGFETKFRNAFTQAGKPDATSQFIISSTQIRWGSAGIKPAYINITSGDRLYTGVCWNTMMNSNVLPFVHF